MHLHLTSIVAMVGFYALVLLVGIWAGRARDSSTDSLFLAGRKMPVLVGVFTMTATWVGGGYINGTAEAVYGSGLVWCQAPWGYALALLIGGLFFAEKMRNARYTTFLDPFERRYGKEVGAVLFVPALIGEVFWSAAILTALGTTFGTILGIDYETAICVSAAVAIAYTFLGGLWSVAYTDVVQLLLIAVGLGLAIPFALDRGGGAAEVMERYTQHFGAAASLLPSPDAWRGEGAGGYRGWLWLDMALLLVLGGIPWGVYFQRVLSCRSGRAAKRLSLIAAAGCLLMAIPPGILGSVAVGIDWAAAGAPGAPDGPMVLPYVLRYLTPNPIAVIGLGAVAAAVMSSVDSSVLSVSSMLVCNVYRPLIRPNASDSEMLRVTKAAVLVTGGLATWLALSVKSVYALWYFCADLVYVILFPQLLMVLYVRGTTRRGALAGLVVGLFLRAGGGEAMLGVAPLLPYPMQDPELGVAFPFRTTAMLASLLTIWLVSRLTAPRTEGSSAAVRTVSPTPLAEAQSSG